MPRPRMALASLVSLAAQGDGDAFRDLVEPHVAAALGMSRVLLGSRDDAADAVQDGMLAAWRGLPALREPEAFPAWFRKLVIRASMRRVRSRRPVVELDLEIAAPGSHLEHAVQWRGLQRAFRSLDAQDRLVLTLRHLWGASVAEAATLLGVPEGTVKSQTHHAMDRLRAAYAAEERR